MVTKVPPVCIVRGNSKGLELIVRAGPAAMAWGHPFRSLTISGRGGRLLVRWRDPSHAGDPGRDGPGGSEA
jgi:hypothetical protein